jgi:hypothetical protein
MPGGRGRSGGRRSGKVGTAYKNRTDLNGPQPVQAAPGQQYGARKAQEDAQRAVPMGTPEVAAAGSAPPSWNPASGLPADMPRPGSLPSLYEDSQRPDLDVMNGARLGPGAGPGQYGLDAGAQARQDLANLARYLPALEQIANRPDSSLATRRLVRMMKANIAMLPPGAE